MYIRTSIKTVDVCTYIAPFFLIFVFLTMQKVCTTENSCNYDTVSKLSNSTILASFVHFFEPQALL